MSYLKQFLPADAIAFSGPNNPDYTEGATKDQGYRNTTTGELFTFDGLNWVGSQTGVVNNILSFNHPDLVLAYTMDVQIGSSLIEQGPNGYDGTISGAYQIAGKIGNGLLFNAGGNHVATDAVIPRSPYFDGSWCVTFWANFGTKIDSFPRIISYRDDTLTFVDGWEFALNASDQIFMAQPGSTAINTTYTPTAGLKFYVITYDRGVGLTVHVDDVEVANVSSVAQPNLNEDQKLYIGNEQGLANGLVGMLDQMRLFKRKLTPQERTTLFQEGSP